jgi:predicted sulfurtransferase
VSTPIGDENTHTTIATCLYTDEPTDTCENCRYSPCNARVVCGQKEYRRHAGFCSSECYSNARQDLLVKNSDRDPVDYKSLRGIIKQDPTQKQAISDQIGAYLEKQLGGREFRHSKSQKEKVLYDWKE